MGAHTLVIEDNLTNLALTGCFKAFGRTAMTAMDGEEGLAAVHRGLTDLIGCDVQIPKFDGYEVAQRLKNHPTYRGIPLVHSQTERLLGYCREELLGRPLEILIPERFRDRLEDTEPATLPTPV